jgi:predicted nuclease of predicted toxin-antitoxin system
MQFKLDQNLPPAAADLLRELGHDVMTVYDQGLQSCTDPEVLAACQGEGKVLLSLDLDFSNILVYPPERYAGLIVLRGFPNRFDGSFPLLIRCVLDIPEGKCLLG